MKPGYNNFAITFRPDVLHFFLTVYCSVTIFFILNTNSKGGYIMRDVKIEQITRKVEEYLEMLGSLKGYF